MRKMIILSIMLLSLTACTSTNINLDEPKNLFSVNEQEYTEEDLLNEILNLDYGQIIIQKAEEKVVNELLETSDYDIEGDFQTEYNQFESYAESMNMTMDQLVSAYGFADIEGFEDQIKRSIVMDRYTQEQLEDNFDAAMKNYELFAVNVYQVDSEETATQMIRYVQSDYEMDAFEKEFDLEESQEAIYHNQIDEMPEDLKEKMNSLDKDKAFFEEVAEEVYAVYVYSQEPTEEIASQVILQETDYAQSVMIDLIRKNNLKIYHSQLKKNMQIDFSEYIK